MDYHLKARSWVDMVHVFCDGPLGMMIPAENYDEMHLGANDIKVFNFTFINRAGPIQASFNILSYGQYGGSAEYKLSDLLSEPISAGSTLSNIVVNTPENHNAVLLEFPQQLREALGVSRWLYMIRLDTKCVKTANNYDNHDLLARGIDPVARNWVAQVKYIQPEWATQRLDDFIKYVDSHLVTVHCFEVSLMQDVSIVQK